MKVAVNYHLWYLERMKWENLLSTVALEPVFSSALLLTLDRDPADVRKQLSRWTKAGKLIQLRRGLYTLAEPYRKRTPSPFLIANRLREPSYVSLQSALAHHGLIPEYVPAVTSLTTAKPGEITTPLGQFIYRHCKKPFFHGYREVELTRGQAAFMAVPEKALLDLVHLTPSGDRLEFLDELRLQNFELLDLDALQRMAQESRSPKLVRAAEMVIGLAEGEKYESL